MQALPLQLPIQSEPWHLVCVLVFECHADRWNIKTLDVSPLDFIAVDVDECVNQAKNRLESNPSLVEQSLFFSFLCIICFCLFQYLINAVKEIFPIAVIINWIFV